MTNVDWSIARNALKVVAETEMCSAEELQVHIDSLKEIIDTDYYDGVGDCLLKQVQIYLESRLKEKLKNAT